MSSEVRPQNEQSQQDQALDLYLEGLLTDSVPDKAHVKPNQSLAHQPKKVEQSEQIQSANSSKIEETTKKSGRNLPADKPKAVKTKNHTQSGQLESSSLELKLLTFKIGNLTFATPLSDISGAISFPDSVSILPSQPEWFMGLFRHNGAKIAVADTGRLINHRQPNYKRSISLQPYSTILLLKGGKWGLACDEIDGVICSSKEGVKWREKKENRPWLMGMVMNPSMALINVQNLIPF
jgi:purine-binding chemotaxis protein CheW